MPDSSLSGGDVALVAIVLVISLAALGFAAYLVKAVLAPDSRRLTSGWKWFNDAQFHSCESRIRCDMDYFQ